MDDPALGEQAPPAKPEVVVGDFSTEEAQELQHRFRQRCPNASVPSVEQVAKTLAIYPIDTLTQAIGRCDANTRSWGAVEHRLRTANAPTRIQERQRRREAAERPVRDRQEWQRIFSQARREEPGAPLAHTDGARQKNARFLADSLPAELVARYACRFDPGQLFDLSRTALQHQRQRGGWLATHLVEACEAALRDRRLPAPLAS